MRYVFYSLWRAELQQAHIDSSLNRTIENGQTRICLWGCDLGVLRQRIEELEVLL